MTTVVPNPVMLTEASTSPSNKVGVTIYDNGVSLVDNTLRCHFVGLYQNGVEVGSVTSDGRVIQYKGSGALKIFYYSGYTFALQLQRNTLPNGDYVAVISRTKDDETKNYEVPIRIELTRESITEYPSITKNQYELNRYELNQYELNLT